MKIIQCSVVKNRFFSVLLGIHGHFFCTSVTFETESPSVEGKAEFENLQQLNSKIARLSRQRNSLTEKEAVHSPILAKSIRSKART